MMLRLLSFGLDFYESITHHFLDKIELGVPNLFDSYKTICVSLLLCFSVGILVIDTERSISNGNANLV